MTIPEKISKIDAGTVRQLAQQLANWAQEFISGGRSPFRRVETFASLLTETGEITPPLVFWINRDSHMAGGAVFFPEGNETSSLPEGERSADALGLNYYVAWGARNIALWQRRDEQWANVRTLAIGRNDRPSPVDFHDALLRLMEEMKTFSVLGAVAPDKLSPYYLANLVRATMLSLLPPLTEHYRIHRGLANNEQGDHSAERQALGKAMLTLTRIMALALHDALPKAVQPQKLEESVGKTLDTLPAPLPQTLRVDSSEAILPEETQVRLHLLLHRLTQLGIAQTPHSSIQALEILQRKTASELGAHPLPPPLEPATGTVLLLYPDQTSDNNDSQVLVNSPSMLALQSLLRHVHRLAPSLAHATDPMELLPDPAPDYVCGTLMDNRLPSAAERQLLAARLRLSWPARRFRLPPRTPLWAWHLLHLLGLANASGYFHLVTPNYWLSSVYGRQLLDLLLQNATLRHVQACDHGLCLEFRKERQPDMIIRVEHGVQTRQIANSQLQQGHASLLQLALLLPAEVWDMLDDARLSFPTSQSWAKLSEQGIFFYSRSSLGRYLWHVTSGGRPLPRRTALRTEVLRKGLPLPSEKTLLSLRDLQTDGTGEPSVALLDQELALWLGTKPDLPVMMKPNPDETCNAPKHDHSEQDILDAVAELVFIDGIPIFPEHYLYDYYRPEMHTFNIQAPLTIGEEFFGTIELQDAQGHTLQVEGMETAQALELISSSRSGLIELPVDRSIMAAILDRYRQDLRRLRSNLVKETFRRQADPRASKVMVEKLWQQKSLPPWRLLS